MKIRRILASAITAALLAGLAGCSNFETYGTLDTGLGASHISTQQ